MKEFQVYSATTSGCQVASFHNDLQATVFYGYYGAEGGNMMSYNGIKLTILIKIQQFFLNKFFRNFCKPLADFHSFEEFNSDIFFARVLTVFMEEKILKGPFFLMPPQII